METELCNMCMVTDGAGRVLVQERLPKPSNPWSGLTFPGGHVESDESFVSAAIREVKEETGLLIKNPVKVGYMEFPEMNFYVHIYKSTEFEGNIIENEKTQIKKQVKFIKIYINS